MKKNYKARTISLPSSFYHAVDLIVPFHGQYDKVTRLLDSVYTNTRSNYFTMSLVDDCSVNESFLQDMSNNITNTSGSRSVSNFQAIRNERQLGFAASIKKAFDTTNNPYVCVLHSDCLVEDNNWLRSLGECLLSMKKDDVRMVSPVTNNPVGGHESQKGNKLEKNLDHVILDGEEDYLSMYCFLCHRELFARCGGFLKEYPYGFYEDVEFAWRMRKNNFKQAVCKNSWIKHEGSSTVRNLWKKNPSVKNIMEEENRNRCIQDIKLQ